MKNDIIPFLLNSLEANSLIIFCGAGVSFNSGIMTVHPMIQYLLRFLSAEQDDITAYLTGTDGNFRLPIPFEAIIESLKTNLTFKNSSQSFIEVFAKLFDGNENINHRLMAQLLENKKVLSIVTTNFDTCIEQALGWNNGDSRVVIPYIEPLDALKDMDITGKLIKLHGCKSRPDYLGTTVEQITKTEYWTKTMTVLDKIFCADESRTVLFLGYSCSDLWDVAEYFHNARLLNKRLAHCIYWQHSNMDDVSITANAYQMLDGHACSYFGGDTNLLIRKLYELENLPIQTDAITQRYNDFGNLIPQNPEFVLGKLFEDSSYFDLAIKYFELVLNSKEKPSTDIYIQSISGLGKMYAAKNDFQQAIKILRTNLQSITHSNIHDLTPGLLMIVTEYANILVDTNDCFTAKKLYEYTIHLIADDSNNAPPTPLLAHLYNDLSLVLQKLQDYENAKGYFEKALGIFREYAEESPQAYLPNVAMVLCNEAIMLNEMGEFNRAKQLYEEALKIRKKLLKTNPVYLPDLATTLNNYGVAQQTTGDYESAKILLDEALDIRRNLAQSNAKVYLPFVATTLLNKAANCKHLQDYTSAEQSCIEAIDIYARFLEADPNSFPMQMAEVLINLSGILVISNRLIEALPYCENAVKLCEKSLHRNRITFLPVLVLGYTMLATIYQYMNSFKTSYKIYRKLLRLSNELVELNRPANIAQHAKILYNYANANYTDKKFKKAKELFEAALKIFEELSVEHPDIYLHNVRMTLKMLASIDETDEDHIPRWERIISIDRYFAEKNPQIYLENLALDLRKFADVQMQLEYIYQAEKLYKEALCILDSFDLKASPHYVREIIGILNCLGIVNFKFGEYDEAILLYRKALKYNDAYPDEALEKYYYYIYVTYYNMSISQSEKGSGRQQILCLKKSVSAARRLVSLNEAEYTPTLINGLHQLAHACYSSGLYKMGEEYFAEVERLM